MRALISILVLITGTQAFANTCFWGDRIRDFRVHDSRTLVVREIGNVRYRVSVAFCNQLQWARRIAFDSWGAKVCRYDDVYIFTNGYSNYPDDVCRIRSITRMN